MVFICLVGLICVGVLATDILAFFPLNVLNMLHLPQGLLWVLGGGAIAWLIGND